MVHDPSLERCFKLTTVEPSLLKANNKHINQSITEALRRIWQQISESNIIVEFKWDKKENKFYADDFGR